MSLEKAKTNRGQRTLIIRRDNRRLAYGTARMKSQLGPSIPTPLAPSGWNRRPGGATELKYSDVVSTSYACDTTGAVTLLNGIAQGDDVTTRDGRTVYNASIRVIGKFTAQAVTGVLDTLCRVILVWDTSPNSAALVPVITDILTASTSVSHLNLNNRARFVVLRDHMVSYGGRDNTATQAFSTAPGTGELDWYVRLGKSKTVYSGTTNAIGSIASGALYLVTIGDRAVNTGFNFVATTRLRFTE